MARVVVPPGPGAPPPTGRELSEFRAFASVAAKIVHSEQSSCAAGWQVIAAQHRANIRAIGPLRKGDDLYSLRGTESLTRRSARQLFPEAGRPTNSTVSGSATGHAVVIKNKHRKGSRSPRQGESCPDTQSQPRPRGHLLPACPGGRPPPNPRRCS